MSDAVSPYSTSVFAALFHLLDREDRWLHHAFTEFFSDVPILDRLVWRTNLTSRGLLLAVVGLVLLWILPASCEWLLRRLGRIEPNFRGDKIPQSFGLVLLGWAGSMLLLDAWLLPAGSSERRIWFLCIAGFGALGLLDDLTGDKKLKGFRGHFRALLKDHRVSTGLIKAVGGLLIAMWLGYSLHPHHPPLVLLSSLLIVLSANTLNLLDLRPGRAGGVFCLTAVFLLVGEWRHAGAFSVPSLLYLLVPAMVVWERDARAAVMLGDIGSNLLGAALGLGFSIYTGVMVQLVLCTLLVGVQILAERVSLTALIEKNSVLRQIDRLTGVRNILDNTIPSDHQPPRPPNGESAN